MEFRRKRGDGYSLKSSFSSSFFSGKKIWTEEEDILLKILIDDHGTGNWSLIAESFRGRTGKQCRERWHNQLSPHIKKGDWTLTEDRILVAMQKAVGNRWATISKLLPGRSDNDVKNRFHATIMTRLKRGDEKELYYDDNGNPLKVQDLVDASVVHYLVVAHVDEATATNDTITTSDEQCSVVLTSTASSFSSSLSSLHTPMALDTRLLETAPMGHQSMEDSDGCLCIATQLLESPRISIDSIELCDFDNGPDGINTPANAIPLDIDLHGLRDWMRDDDDDEDYDDYCDIDVDCIEMNGFDVVGMDVESQDKKDYDHQESKKSSICSTFAHSLGNFCNNGMMNLDSYSADDHGESNWLSSCSSHFNHSKSGGNNYNHPESEGDSICSYGLSSLRSSIPRLS